MHNEKNDSQQNSDQNWEPCPQGILDDVAETQKGSLSRRSVPLIPLAAAIAACLLVALAIYAVPNFLPSSQGDLHGDITCSVCISRMDDYHDERLSVKEVAVVDAHLDVCPACRKKYQTALDKLTHYVRDIYRVAFVVPSLR
jgi:hypothetical protein